MSISSYVTFWCNPNNDIAENTVNQKEVTTVSAQQGEINWAQAAKIALVISRLSLASGVSYLAYQYYGSTPVDPTPSLTPPSIDPIATGLGLLAFTGFAANTLISKLKLNTNTKEKYENINKLDFQKRQENRCTEGNEVIKEEEPQQIDETFEEFPSDHSTKWICLKRLLNEDSPLEPHIPDMEELLNLPVERIQELWRLNNETLIGIIAKKEIPHFGFHGTNEKGVKGIQQSRQSGKNTYDRDNFIWVASYDYQLDPITALADFYTIAEKAQGYMFKQDGNGGVFTISIKKEEKYRKYITSSQPPIHYYSHEKTPDTQAEGQFIKLIHRNRNVFDDSINHSQEAVKLYSHSIDWISSKELFPADEFHVRFDKNNYKETVKGLLKTRDRAISMSCLNQLHDLAKLDWNSGIELSDN